MTTDADGWVAEFAPAKVNLTLHVTGRRADGYHLLDSLVVFADPGDRISLRPAEQMSLTVTGPLADGVPQDARNLCWRAAVAFGQTVEMVLDKHLPHAAGIGGGSSDAAAVLRAMARAFGRDFAGNAAALGADVPVCLLARAARMRGVGEDVMPVTLPPLSAVLVNPRVSVPTPQVFSAMTRRDNPAMPDLPQGDVLAWLADQRNDMQEAAIALAPEIGAVIQAIAATGAAVARMSGSGATCFGLYGDAQAARAAAQTLAEQHPDWWVRDCVLG